MATGRASVHALAVLSGWLLLIFALGCDSQPATSTEPAPSTAPVAAPASTPEAPKRASAPRKERPSASSAAKAPSLPTPAEAKESACPHDMALVSGSYCPLVQHRCIQRPSNHGRGPKHHCKRYAKSKCLGPNKRRNLRFCMDRFEWPNRRGSLPRTLTSWPEARKLCASKGKRLCNVDEFNFACEGESMKPHVYGFERRDDICNSDRPYRARTYNYKRWDECMKLPACKAQYERLDQRVPAGSRPKCVSEHGVYDLNGNANEWVFRRNQKFPKRSGLKGGWWGPVRNRCRPMTTFHLEGDYGYEVGFRCCKDAG